MFLKKRETKQKEIQSSYLLIAEEKYLFEISEGN